MSTEPRKRGRQAEAERNNVRILEAAREVFIANPAAPISEVANRAGVGIAALYHRYPSKNALLAQLCLDGQDTYIELVEKALASTDIHGGRMSSGCATSSPPTRTRSQSTSPGISRRTSATRPEPSR